jgi:hypothetical protein
MVRDKVRDRGRFPWNPPLALHSLKDQGSWRRRVLASPAAASGGTQMWEAVSDGRWCPHTHVWAARQTTAAGIRLQHSLRGSRRTSPTSPTTPTGPTSRIAANPLCGTATGRRPPGRAGVPPQTIMDHDQLARQSRTTSGRGDGGSTATAERARPGLSEGDLKRGPSDPTVR